MGTNLRTSEEIQEVEASRWMTNAEKRYSIKYNTNQMILHIKWIKKLDSLGIKITFTNISVEFWT